MCTIKITIEGGTTYEIDLDGCFLRYNKHKWDHPHETWKCSGVAERLAFNNMRYYSLDELIYMIKVGEIKTYKNGSARFYLRDIDHNTHRLQGNGIVSACIN